MRVNKIEEKSSEKTYIKEPMEENRINLESVAHKEIETLSNCITGDSDFLLPRIKNSIKRAKSIDIIVAFLMESGVKLITEDLKEAVERGINIRILTGNYLNITQPQALFLLKDALSDKVDLRFYNVPNKSFHPKAYIFEYEDDGDIFVGSSNISKSALTSGIEWNYRISKNNHERDFKKYKDTFENLFNNYSIIVDDNELDRYSKRWKRPKLFLDLEKSEDNNEENKIINYPAPKGAQIEALYKLKKFREEGFDRGIVVAATGIGKTYLAAFDSKDYSKVLFVAHREEIIKQAKASFACVRPNISMGFFTGVEKNKDVDILFATVQTLGQKEYLKEEYFQKDYFDYIIIDEFHHAVSKNYTNLLEYFTPKFLLGLTATPERMDNRDVFEICNHEVVYEVRLKEAINKGWLVPFRYYGIYDETNYKNISFRNGKYDGSELEKALMIEKRSNLILNHYKKYNSKIALGFCSSRNHANYMAKYFSENGVTAYAVLSGDKMEYSMDRQEAINKLKNGEIKVLFSVDMFNEGLDITSVDMVMFLRPTESPTVFLQQLGRGLRRHKDKTYVNVLDFIGNYKKANLVPFFLSGDVKNINSKAKGKGFEKVIEYPQDCIIDFDFRLVDLFKKMEDEEKKINDIIIEEFYRVKSEVGEIPTRLQMYKYMDDDVYNNIRSKPKINIFNDYLGFLNSINELTEDEKQIINTKSHEFIKRIETTSMTKTYKMPLLLAFYNGGNFKTSITEDEIYLSFKEFYSKPSNAIDLLIDKSGKEYKTWGKKEYLKIAKNPRNAFINSAEEFFEDKGDIYLISKDLKAFENNKTFIKHFKDVIDYRTSRFYKERLEKREED